MVADLRVNELEGVLSELIDAAKRCFSTDLVLAALFGSAAEDRLRPGSDVNILFVLECFDAVKVDAFRAALRTAHSALRVQAMFLLRAELPVAAELFAVKFNDMRTRHRMLHGPDLLKDLVIDNAELRRRLREDLLNLAIRLRERYVMVSLREEQLVAVIASAAPPLRASAMALLKLRGIEAPSLREALETVVAGIGNAAFSAAVANLSQAREEQRLPPGVAGPMLLAISGLATHLRAQLEGVAES
jgi:predicted nucleotidyltransferase